MSLVFQPRDNAPNNFMHTTTTLCNNASIIDTYIMQPMLRSVGEDYWPTEQNTTFAGTFSPTRASITWSGNYFGGFQSISYGVPSKEDLPQGYFNLRFEGEIDKRRSDRLVPRPDDPETMTDDRYVGGPDWVEVLDREENIPTKRLYYTNDAVVMGSGSLWVIVALAMALFAL